MLRLALTALVAAAWALVAGVGCSSPESSPGGAFEADDNPTLRPRAQGVDAGDVLVIGDSLTNGAQLYGDLAERLEDAGFDDITVIAQDGRDTEWGVRQVQRRVEVAPVVVVELGTNPGPEVDGYEAAVSEMVAELRRRGAERIVWLTPTHGRDDRYARKVAILQATPGVEIADWASVAQDDPRRLAADGLHPNEAGYAVLAEFITEAAIEAANET